MRGYGFMYHAQAYRRVLMVATGAGIGPVLPYLLGRPPVTFECLWIGRRHGAAMGTDLVDRVLADGSVTLIDACAPDPESVWSWSRWRRRRQYQARLCHYRHRGYAFA